MVDARRMDLLYDVQALSNSIKEHSEKMQISFDQREADTRNIMNDHIALVNEELCICQNETAAKIKEIVDLAINNKFSRLAPVENKHGYNIAVVVAVLGALAWCYWKIA